MTQSPSLFDIGLISFRAAPDDPIRTLSPVIVPAHFVSEIGDPIAVYGYAFGQKLLKWEIGTTEQTYRFGPILQQGYISGIAPFDHSQTVSRLLLDIRTAEGMSGAPVFDPQTGSVIAIHTSGIEDTIAFALPLNAEFIAQIVATNSKGFPGDQTMMEVSRVRRP